MTTTRTPEEIAQEVAIRLQGKRLTVYGQEMFIDAQNVVRAPDGSTVWEFEEQDYTGWTPEKISQELETIFYYDKEIFDSEQSLND